MGTCKEWDGNDCKMKDTCNRECGLHVSKALCDLMDKTITLDTGIGNLESSDGKQLDMIVVGMELFGTCSGKVMSKNIDRSIQLSDVFNRSMTNEALHIAEKQSGREKCLEYEKKIKKMNTNKCVALPFGKNTRFEVLSNGKVCKGSLNHYCWKIDENGKLEGSIYIFIPGPGRVISKSIKDYGKELVVDNPIIPSGNIGDVIEMNEIGYFNPLEIVNSSEGTKIIVDNKYVYFYNGNKTMIIGEWQDMKIKFNESADELSTRKEVKALKKYYEAISMHHKYMIPYRLHEAKVMTI